MPQTSRTKMIRIERDKLQRVIRIGDVCVWANKKYGKGLDLVRIDGYNKKSLRVINIETGAITRIEDTKNLIVISQQILANIDGNVGANLDLEATR